MSQLTDATVTALGRANINLSKAVAEYATMAEILSQCLKCWLENMVGFLPAATWMHGEKPCVYGQL